MEIHQVDNIRKNRVGENLVLARKKIVIVDDFEESCKLLSEVLSDDFDCSYTAESTAALDLIKKIKPDLVILDFKMPVLKGTDLCKLIRMNVTTKYLPIVFVSGAAEIEDKIEAFELGADDFVSKPFHVKELILRLKARLTDRDQEHSELFAGNLSMNLIQRQVHVAGEEVYLTPKQFDILKLLVEGKNELVLRDRFLSDIWGDTEVSSRNVDSQINYLKRKIEKFNGRISAVPSQGYRLTVTEN